MLDFEWPTNRLNAGGLLVAGVGFVLTRFTVLTSLRPDASTVGFLIGEAPALVAGFGLTAFGLGLAMDSRDPADARVIARWCFLGAGSMCAIVALTYATVGFPSLSGSTTTSRLIANVVVGGAVGGTLTGIRSASLRHHREGLARQTDRLTVLNRLLRHEVLNKVNIIAGYAGARDGATGGDSLGDAWSVVQRHADAIDGTIDEIGMLTESGDPEPVDPSSHLDDAVAAVRETHPSATIDVDTVPSVPVRGSPYLGVLFERLLENAVVHNDRPERTVRVRTRVDDRTVAVRIVDDGPGLPPEQRRLIDGRVTPERDDPRSGFGLAIARLILDDIDGRMAAESPVSDGRGTALTVTLRLAGAHAERFGVASSRLGYGAVAGLTAGAAMGVVAQFVTDRISVIGALYGVENVAIGWISHQYHSVVFAMFFVAAIASQVRDGGSRRFAALGAGYGVFLWLVAAGIVMPLWLRAVGVPAPLPTLRPLSLANHLLWGVVFGGIYGWLCDR